MSRFYRTDGDRWLEQSIQRWREVLFRQRRAYHAAIFLAVGSCAMTALITIITIVSGTDTNAGVAASGFASGVALVAVATRRRMMRGTARHIESLRSKLNYPRPVN